MDIHWKGQDIGSIWLSKESEEKQDVTFIDNKIPEIDGEENEALKFENQSKLDNSDEVDDQIIGNPNDCVKTRRDAMNKCLHGCFPSQVEPKKVEETLLDLDWIIAMQEELNQF